MATTIVSNLAVFSDSTGHGNQSHLVYAATQQRWWLFNCNTKTATVVSCYVSSSNDLTTATWSASTDSPAFPNSRALVAAKRRYLACQSVTNGSTDAVHVGVSLGQIGSSVYHDHIRATFTGASSITWESWVETATVTSTDTSIAGNSLGLSTPSNFVHEESLDLQSSFSTGRARARISTNADTGATWTSGYGAAADADSQANYIAASAFAPLASDAMLLVYGNGGAAQPNTTGLRSNKYTSGTTWPTTGSVVTGNGTTTQDQNDMGLCGVDTTHAFSVRRSGSNTFDVQMYDGSNWGSKTAPPNQNHLAASGIFSATDGTNLWLFLLDSAANQPVQYCKYTVASDSWGTWTTLEAAGSTARNYISGCPTVANNQIGVIFTQVNGSNFDVVVTALALVTPPGVWPFQSNAFQYAVPGSTGRVAYPSDLAGLGGAAQQCFNPTLGAP